MNILKQIDKYTEEYAFDCGTSGSRFDPDEFIATIKELVSKDRQKIIDKLEELSTNEFVNRNYQCSNGLDMAIKVFKGEE